MSEVTCTCPGCQCTLRVNLTAEKSLIDCPKCAKRFEVRRGNTPAPAQPVARPTQPIQPAAAPLAEADPFSQNVLGELPAEPTNWQTQQPQGYYAAKRPRSKTKSQGLNWKLWSIVGGIGALVVGGIVLALTVDFSDLPLAGLSPFSRVEHHESVTFDMDQLCRDIEQDGRAIPDDGRTKEAADKLLARIDDLHEMLARACRCKPFPVSPADLEEKKSEADELREKLRSGSTDPNDFFWHAGIRQEDPVAIAITQLTRTRATIYLQLTRGLVEYEDPLTSEYPGTDWTEKDKRNLAIMRSQGQLMRDFNHALAMVVDPADPSSSEIRKLEAVIDRYSEVANSFVQAKGGSSIMVMVPRDVPFENYANVNRVVNMTLRDNLEMSERVEWLNEDCVLLFEQLENLIFRPTRTPVACKDSAARRYQKEQDDASAAAEKLAAEEKAKRDAEEREQQRLAEEKELERQREQQRQQEMAQNQEKIAQNSKSTSADATGGEQPSDGNETQQASNGRRRFGPPGFGPPPGFGTGSAPQMGNRPFGSRGNSPPSSPVDPRKAITIKVTGSATLNSRELLEMMPQSIKLSSGLSVSTSNKQGTITLRNPSVPIEKLEEQLPFLEFENVDKEKRTIKAKLK